MLIVHKNNEKSYYEVKAQIQVSYLLNINSQKYVLAKKLLRNKTLRFVCGKVKYELCSSKCQNKVSSTERAGIQEKWTTKYKISIRKASCKDFIFNLI